MMDETNPNHEPTHLENLYDVKSQLLNAINDETNLERGVEWITIKEKLVIQLILDAFINPEKKKILNITSDKSLTVPEILEICKVPTTSGYRIINSLERNGLLVKSYVDTMYGKRLTKYRSIFDNVRIIIEKNNVSIKAKFTKM